MSWIDVPVPAELEAEVRTFIMRLHFQTGLAQWDWDSMAEHLGSLAPEPRTLLSAVAAGVMKGDLVEDTDIARLLGVNVREVYGVVREANGGKQGDIVYARTEQVNDGAGGIGTRNVLFMFEGYAVLIRDQDTLLGLGSRPE